MLFTFPGMSLDRNISKAVDLFRQSKFDEALVQYNSIIRHIQSIDIDDLKRIRLEYGLAEVPKVGPVIHPKIGSILDQRAATFEKLGNFSKAIRDGENLIKLEPIGCKGYLRVAKIRLLQGDELESYKVLQRGVYTISSAVKKYKVKVPESLYGKLEARYKELNSKLKKQRVVAKVPENSREVSPSVPSKRVQHSLDGLLAKRSKSEPSRSSLISSDILIRGLSQPLSPLVQISHDPFDYFPLELIYLIFSHLPPKVILNSHLVSSKWYKSLTSIPSLYNSISFKNRIDKQEFLNGFKLIKRIYQNSQTKVVKRMKISRSLKEDHFIENLKYLAFQLNLKLEKLEILNPNVSIGEILLAFTRKHATSSNIDFSGLSPLQDTLKVLKLGVSSEIKNIPYLLGILKSLRNLEIIQLSPKVKSVTTLPEQVKLNFKENLSTEHLENFTFIGASDNENINKVENDGNGAVPYMIRLLSPALKSLTIVSQDLLQCNFSFENFPVLSEVYFENNSGYGLRDFVLEFTSPIGCKLSKLSFREKDDLNSQIFDDTIFRNLEFPRLSNLKFLDVYSSNLTKDGLYKLLEVCNCGSSELKSLNIGNSRKLCFQIDTLQSRARNNISQTAGYLSIKEILKRSPNLTHLYLNEIEFDNFSAKMFYKDLKEFCKGTFDKIKLKYLDLSFVRIDGIGLMDLFFVSTRQPVSFKLDELILNGIDINQQTIQLLINKGYSEKIQNDFRKIKWKEFGKNSLIQ